MRPGVYLIGPWSYGILGVLGLREFRRYGGGGLACLGQRGTLGRLRVMTFYQSVWKYSDILKTGRYSHTGAEQLSISFVCR